MRGLRKWTVVQLSLLYAFVLAMQGKLTYDFVIIAGIAVGAFAAANSFEHKVKNGTDEVR